ncbi:hypothetical protein HS041_19925 [Planomonospora sp. ID67723]|uniref:hypothetical protein n=1 Tax=Planomonospora sp. ID67723 TaxID=2738134 RepID=UPI0018C38347|nr:hypothetical protein [Planomonospora sp. ID67723]MBG0830039.1 hypothetical protein [Planomonospora sp. ID67723]
MKRSDLLVVVRARLPGGGCGLAVVACGVQTAAEVLLSVPAGQRPLFLALAVLQAMAAAAGWRPIWRRLHPWAPLVLCLPALTVLSASIWAAGGIAAGAAPFLK